MPEQSLQNITKEEEPTALYKELGQQMTRFLITKGVHSSMLNLIENPMELRVAAWNISHLKVEEYETLEEYYEKEPWSLLRNLAYHAYRDFSFMEDVAPLNSRLLDYGAGAGYFTESALSYDKLSVDIRGITCDFLSRNGATVATAPYTPVRESWDIIVCVDVLEHTEKPKEVLESLLNGLKIGGKFLYFFADSKHDAGHISIEHKERCDQMVLDQCVLRAKYSQGRYPLFERIK